MDVARETNDEQKALWSGIAGKNWVEAQALLNEIYKPFEDMLVEAVARETVGRILDVGCGPGSLTLAVARLLGPQGHCVGIDISEPMIAAASARAAQESVPAEFLRADAQEHIFAPGSFDMIVSRFGVMFFEDSVRAFANLRRAVRDDAALRFLAWRSAAENPFMTAAERAAAPFLPDLPPRPEKGPGQFAFADADRVRGILQDSGWTAIDIQPIDVACSLPAKDLDFFLTRLGPVSRVLPQVDERAREKVIGAVRAAFETYVQGADVRFTAACWMVGAKAGGM